VVRRYPGDVAARADRRPGNLLGPRSIRDRVDRAIQVNDVRLIVHVDVNVEVGLVERLADILFGHGTSMAS